MLEDDFDDVDDGGLMFDLIPIGRDRKQSRPEADRQVVGIHHVLVRILGQVLQEREQIPEWVAKRKKGWRERDCELKEGQGIR